MGGCYHSPRHQSAGRRALLQLLAERGGEEARHRVLRLAGLLTPLGELQARALDLERVAPPLQHEARREERALEELRLRSLRIDAAGGRPGAPRVAPARLRQRAAG